MPEQWLPTDPRQREIHRLLLLVGGEPAAFFRDACRLMDGDYQLEATTHVVAHLLRELDGALREVLRPMVPPEAWPERNTENAHRKQIDAICDALGIETKDALRELWREYAPPLPEFAHRYSRAAPRPIDEDFRDLWAKGQIVVLRVAGRIEANYTLALPIVDELATSAPDVSRLRQAVAHSTVVLDRFFDRAEPQWLEALRDEGYFRDPPPLIHDDDGSVSYARWPQGRFIRRVAANEPDAVIEIGLAITSDNPEAHEALVDAALAMAPEQAARLTPKVLEWLATPVQWQLPFKAQALVIHLGMGGQTDEALTLLRTLVTSERMQRDAYAAGEIIREVTAEIFPTVGLAGLELYAELLNVTLAEQAEGGNDYSYIWRPDLAADQRQDFRDSLVSAVRDASAALAQDAPELVGDVVEVLERYTPSIFARLALDLLSQHPKNDLANEHLTSRDLLLDRNAEREYENLALACFEGLDSDEKGRILGFIEAGPDQGADDADYVGAWQLRMLRRFPEPLPEDWQKRIEELSAKYPGLEAPRLPEVGWVGPNAPIGRDELEEMTIDAMVRYLGDWHPPEDTWRAPSREGLARVLRQVVSNDPERFAEGAIAFADVDPTYVHALIGGLREALTNKRGFSWPAVIQLSTQVLDRPRQIEGRDPTGLNGDDPGWAWTWQDIAHLLGDGLARADGGIPSDEREHVWAVIERLAEDEHPTPEDERREGDGRMGPALLAMNSVRGSAVEAAIRYVWWLRGEANDPRIPDEVRALLERHLDPTHEPSLAVHSLYGRWFPYLATADPTWIDQHLHEIFPPSDEQRRRAAFHSYLHFNNVWESPFRLIIGEHAHALGELVAENTERDPVLGDVGEALVNHLMTAYRVGLLTFGDGTGVLERFYELATSQRRAAAIESIGRLLMTDSELTNEMAERLQDLWTMRLASVVASQDTTAREELRGFAWWFASGKLDPAWSLEQLRASLTAGGRIDPDHLVAETLVTLLDQHLADVVQTLELMIETGTKPWFVLGARNEIEAILVTGLNAEGDTSTRARDIVNRLVARGHVDYEHLLVR